LQAWLGRGGQHAAELARILEKRGVARDKAELVVRLLHFYAPDALDRQQTYAELVNQLDDEEFLVRHLSFWQLDQLGAGGRLPDAATKIIYDPTWNSQERRQAVEQWKKLVSSGKLPSRP